MLSPLPLPTRRCDRRLPARAALRASLVITRYPTQWRSFLGLFPEYLVQRGLLRRETIQAVDPALLADRPHPGALLYERLMGFPYARFREAVDPFLARHLS